MTLQLQDFSWAAIKPRPQSSVMEIISAHHIHSSLDSTQHATLDEKEITTQNIQTSASLVAPLGSRSQTLEVL